MATAGSCFAQHISRSLVANGFNFFAPEDGEGLSPGERKDRNFGVFSARYGNIYTVRQLRQLLDEALSGVTPVLPDFRRPDGRFVDPLRPRVEPAGHESREGMLEARGKHIAAVKRTFSEADILIFTLGLTEAWVHRASGTVLPVAPGVVAGEYDEAQYEFANFGVDETRADLAAFLERLREINPGVRVLLTVSPVPLVATHEDRSVLVSTIYSKSVLRVVAEEAAQAHDWVDYFPSYEIITGPQAGGLYFEADHRHINSAGVSRAMRIFIGHYCEDAGDGEAGGIMPADISGIVCDEDA